MASEGATIDRSWKISWMRGEEPETPEKSNTLSPRPLRQTMHDPVTGTGRGDQNVAFNAPISRASSNNRQGGYPPTPGASCRLGMTLIS